MENGAKLKSEENLELLLALSEELSLDGLRLMLDPQKPTSGEGIVEDVLLYLIDKKNGRPDRKPLFRVQLNMS